MMKVISWNSGGLGHPSKSTALRDLINSKKPKILLLQETKQSEVDMQKITSKETLYEGTVLESRGASRGAFFPLGKKTNGSSKVTLRILTGSNFFWKASKISNR